MGLNTAKKSGENGKNAGKNGKNRE